MEQKTSGKEIEVFMTGGTGFIGRWLLRELTAKGRRVGVLMRNPGKAAELDAWLDERGGRSRMVRYYTGDLGTKNLGLSESDRTQIQTARDVYHLGAHFVWNANIEEARRINVDGGLELIRLSDHKRLRRFINVSGYKVADTRRHEKLGLDQSESWSREKWNRLYRKIGAYEASKYEAHIRLEKACLAAGIPLTIVNPATVVGNSLTGELNQRDGIGSLIDQIRTGMMKAVPGGSGDWLPIISVDYLAKFMAELPELNESKGKSYTLLDQATPDLKHMLGILAESLDKKAPRIHIPKGVLRTLLKLGGSRLTGLSAEPLEFIDDTKYNTNSTERLAEEMGLKLPEIKEVLQRTADYYARAYPRPGI